MAWEAWGGRCEKNSTEGARGGCSRGDGSALAQGSSALLPSPAAVPSRRVQGVVQTISLDWGQEKRGV